MSLKESTLAGFPRESKDVSSGDNEHQDDVDLWAVDMLWSIMQSTELPALPQTLGRMHVATTCTMQILLDLAAYVAKYHT